MTMSKLPRAFVYLQKRKSDWKYVTNGDVYGTLGIEKLDNFDVFIQK